MGEKKSYRILVVELLGEWALVRLKQRLEDNIKMDLRAIVRMWTDLGLCSVRDLSIIEI
jgi:hypothetical protein